MSLFVIDFLRVCGVSCSFFFDFLSLLKSIALCIGRYECHLLSNLYRRAGIIPAPALL